MNIQTLIQNAEAALQALRNATDDPQILQLSDQHYMEISRPANRTCVSTWASTILAMPPSPSMTSTSRRRSSIATKPTCCQCAKNRSISKTSPATKRTSQIYRPEVLKLRTILFQFLVTSGHSHCLGTINQGDGPLWEVLLRATLKKWS